MRRHYNDSTLMVWLGDPEPFWINWKLARPNYTPARWWKIQQLDRTTRENDPEEVFEEPEYHPDQDIYDAQAAAKEAERGTPKTIVIECNMDEMMQEGGDKLTFLAMQRRFGMMWA